VVGVVVGIVVVEFVRVVGVVVVVGVVEFCDAIPD
jgi:hypothetical protein